MCLVDGKFIVNLFTVALSDSVSFSIEDADSIRSVIETEMGMNTENCVQIVPSGLQNA